MSEIIPFDYQGQAVRFNADGWINATEAASRFGQEPRDWLRLHETEAYMRALAKHLTIPFDPKYTARKPSKKVRGGKSGFRPELSSCAGLVETRRGAPRTGGGTWLHPKLAVAFARWISPDFGVWCDLQIDALIRQGMAAQGHEHLISLLLRPEPSEWERRFPPEYYQALARVTNTRYLGHSGGTPSLYGKLTRKWVYQVIMPREVLAAMDDRRTDGDKLHQWLTDGGAKLLDQQISLVTLIAETSCDLKDFEARCMQRFGIPGQLRLVYPAAA